MLDYQENQSLRRSFFPTDHNEMFKFWTTKLFYWKCFLHVNLHPLTLRMRAFIEQLSFPDCMPHIGICCHFYDNSASLCNLYCALSSYIFSASNLRVKLLPRFFWNWYPSLHKWLWKREKKKIKMNEFKSHQSNGNKPEYM